MRHHAGLHVSLEETSLCIVDGAGKIIGETQVASEPEALVGYFSSLEIQVVCIGLKAWPLSQWLHAALTEAVNADLLAQHAVQIEQEKQELLNPAGLVDRASLMSNDKFANALRAFGIEPPTKISPTTGEITYAFAKSDPAMVELASHDKPAVQALVAARTGHKSTIKQTRTEKLSRIAQLKWPDGKGSGWSPIALRLRGRPSRDAACEGGFIGYDGQNRSPRCARDCAPASDGLVQAGALQDAPISGGAGDQHGAQDPVGQASTSSSACAASCAGSD